jgi:hypothetical protein
LPPLALLTLFWPPLLSPSAIATTTTDANISTAVTINATAAVSVFTDVGLCFCHYRDNCFSMYSSHHDRRFPHSCCRLLVDCCLTHHCHCSANAIANAPTNFVSFAMIECVPKKYERIYLRRSYKNLWNSLTVEYGIISTYEPNLVCVWYWPKKKDPK